MKQSNLRCSAAIHFLLRTSIPFQMNATPNQPQSETNVIVNEVIVADLILQSFLS
jgi:hypothetical protein